MAVHTKAKEMARQRRRGDQFRLLLYERMWQRWAWPCILIVPASIALWWYANRIPIIHDPLGFLTLVPAAVSIAILVYALLARRMAWVQCRSKHLRIQTPFYPLVISYGRIKAVRPADFHKIFSPFEEKAARRQWLRPYWSKTALVVELSQYPLSKTWLRLWLSPYLLSPDPPGFVFVVEDWMALSRQLDDFRNRWEARRAARRQRDLSRRAW
jgi:hypothetical protein